MFQVLLQRPYYERAETQTDILDWVKGLIKRLGNSWRGSLLTMEDNSKDLTAPDTFPSLCADIAENISVLLEGKESSRIDTVLTDAEKILRAFLSSKYVITNIDRDGLVQLVVLAVQSRFEPECLGELEMRIGFGATPTVVPNARVPAYALAALNILKQLATIEREAADGRRYSLPRVVLYSAVNFVRSINGQDSNGATKRAAQQNFALIRTYLAQFAPDVADRFTFDEDRPIEAGSAIDALIGIYAQALAEATERLSCAARGKVVEMGRAHGSSRENALRYAAAHALYSADPVAGPAEAILQKAPARPRKLLMIGGLPEKTFWRVRETVRRGVTIQKGVAYCRERIDALACPTDQQGYESLLQRFYECSENGNGYKRAQLISQAGKVPVYGKYNGDWDLNKVVNGSLEQLLSAPSFDLVMKRDLLAVLCDIAGLSLDYAYSWTSQKTLPSDVKTQLEEAYKGYSALCSQFLSTELS